jgi:hypothetical protein
VKAVFLYFYFFPPGHKTLSVKTGKKEKKTKKGKRFLAPHPFPCGPFSSGTDLFISFAEFFLHDQFFVAGILDHHEFPVILGIQIANLHSQFIAPFLEVGIG